MKKLCDGVWSRLGDDNWSSRIGLYATEKLDFGSSLIQRGRESQSFSSSRHIAAPLQRVRDTARNMSS
ncbi:hypothetical protein Bca4012_043682 [Brassica carinata]|uniref:Uncharacterized protein n=1 Tax=Brassica carinata TaxID=52824 RepID=A0A8X7QUE5_BRACI|nr:hypothetical protein Bca52824_058672 [Brassica carinata]